MAERNTSQDPSAATADKSAQVRKVEGLPTLVRDLWPFLRPHRWLVAGIVGGLLFEAGFTTLLSMSVKILLDHAILPQDAQALWLILGLLGVGLAMAAVVMIWRDWLYARLGTAVVSEVRQRLFDHLQSLSLAYFTRSPPGALMARFTTDLAAIEQIVVGALPNVISAVLSLAFVLAAMVYLDLFLAVLVCLFIPLFLVGPQVLIPRASVAGDRAKHLEAEVLGAVQENLAAQATIKAMGGEARARSAFFKRLSEFAAANQRFNLIAYLAERLPNLCMAVVHISILSVGSYLAFQGELSIGSLVAFHALLLNLNSAISMLSGNLPPLLHAATGMRRIREVFQEKPSVHDSAIGQPMVPLRKALTVDGVEFGWEGNRVLAGLHLQIEAGTTVALVGPSGSGKSTALALLARFHDPVKGAVFFDGTDVRDIRLGSFREQVSVVLQHTVLMEMSVRDNIRLAYPDATDAEVETAAVRAEADDFVRALPAGYETILGSRGIHLSGGQKQRMAIAQALLRRSSLLLLDEATSALDPGAERRITESLTRTSEGRTTVMVTHHLRQASACDRIFVMDGGMVAEEGTHDELLGYGGIYAGLWRKQNGIEISDDLEQVSVREEWLAEQPLFQDADRAALSEAASRFRVERVEGGLDIMRQGQPGDRFYIIARGSVSVWREDGGKSRELNRLHMGDVFGETALLSSVPRNATVRTDTDTVFLTLERSCFQRWIEHDPHWKAMISQLASERLKPDTEQY